MDTIAQYREIVRNLIREYTSHKFSHGQITSEAILDEQNNHYEVLNSGWDGEYRVHSVAIHIDIIGDKVWVQHDGTNRVIAEELVEAGIPREAIVLGFRPPELRPYSGFAVA